MTDTQKHVLAEQAQQELVMSLKLAGEDFYAYPELIQGILMVAFQSGVEFGARKMKEAWEDVKV